MKVLPELGFENPTPIQEKTIPLLLSEKRDLLGLAQTGTGKTGAFGLPLLDLIDTKNPDTQAIILAPTRELCQQITQQLHSFAKYKKGLNILAVFGGQSIQTQIAALRKPTHIIAATPGRLIDLIGRRKVQLENINYVILDEADEMLNMGFQEDIDTILESASAEKNTWLFSATMPSAIRRIVKSYMHDPVEISVSTGNEVNKNIRHMILNTRADDKLDMLKQILDTEPEMKGIIFTRTKANASDLTAKLVREGYSVDALHGDLSQAQRDRVMQSFKQGRVSVILATDVAARGIDVDDLTHVIHYNLSDDLAFYTHRAGRTARAGKTGISLVFATSRDRRRIRDLQAKLKIDFETWKVPDIDEMYTQRLADWASKTMTTEPDPKNEKVINQAKAILSLLDQEELMDKLLNAELMRIGYAEAKQNEKQRSTDKRDRKKSRNDDRFNDDSRRGGNRKERRNEKFKDKDNDRDRDRRKKSRSRDDDYEFPGKDGGKYHRFFINLGSRDGLSKVDIMDFVAEQGRITRKDIGQVDIHKGHAYIEVSEMKSRGFGKKFEGISVNNRALRVNRDEANAGKSTSPKSKGKKKHKK